MTDEKSWNWTLNDNRYTEINPRVVPVPDIHDEPTRCFKVNLEWSIFVAGAISELLNIKAWSGADDERYTAIQQLLKMLIGEDCMNCDDVVNCLEVNPDYIGLQSAIFSQSESATQAHLDALEAEYDNTPQSVGASIPTVAPDSAEQNALCYALNKFVSLYCAVKLAKVQQANFVNIAWDRIKQFAHSVYNAFTDTFGFILTPNLYSCMVNLAEAEIALQDDDAISEVACCLLDGLDGVVMSLTAFNDAVSDCITLSGNAGKIACLLETDNALQIYIQFLEAYNIAIERGETFDCDCDFSWCNLFDFTLGNQSFIPNPAAPFGVQNANGYQMTYGFYPSTNDNRLTPDREFGAAFTPSLYTLKYVGTAGGAGRTLQLIGYADNVLVFLRNFGAYNTTSVEQTVTYDGVHTIDEIYILGVAAINGGLDTDALTIKSLQIEGDTGDPPVEDNC